MLLAVSMIGTSEAMNLGNKSYKAILMILEKWCRRFLKIRQKSIEFHSSWYLTFKIKYYIFFFEIRLFALH